jgi:putative membrane protein (TIGR04086 family)
MGRASWKGVLIGAVSEVVLSVFLMIVVLIIISIISHLEHIPFKELVHASRYILLFPIGLACSALGGYLSAQIAKHDELLNGGLSSFLSVLIHLFVISSGHDSRPAIERYLVLLAGPAFAILGGYLRLRQKSSQVQAA